MSTCQNGGEVGSSSLATPSHETRRIGIQASGKCKMHFSIVDGHNTTLEANDGIA